tara:strand:+ start:2030 stop:2656 length:627 start_codon:yes stop_codon:yes gene_type:complete
MARLGESFKPQQRVAPQALPKLPPSDPWQFAHHPEAWEVRSGDLVPRVNMISMRPGVNHVPRDGNLDELYMRYEAAGFVFIPYDVGTPKGVESYLQKVPVAGGHAYVSCFVRLVPGSSKVMPDKAGYLRFLKAVKKQVAPPAAYVLDALKGKLEKRQTDLSMVADRVPMAAKQLKQVNADLKIVEKELDAALKRDAQTYDEVIPDGTE